MFLQKRLFPCKTILWEITWGSLKAGIFLAGAILRSLAFTFCHGDKNVPHLGEWMQKTRRWGIPSLPHPGRRPSTLVERSQCSLWCISLDKAEILSYVPKNVLEFAARWFRVLPCSEEKELPKKFVCFDIYLGYCHINIFGYSFITPLQLSQLVCVQSLYTHKLG